MTQKIGSFSVNEWGSHPDEGNDDCWNGSDFDTLEQATVAFDAVCKDSSSSIKR